MGLMHAVAGVAVCSRCPHSLLRVDAVDGANHSLIQLFLEPPPLRLGPAVKRTAVRSCTGYEINDSGESRLTFPVAGTDTVPVERPGENSNVCSHLSLCMRRYERGGGRAVLTVVLILPLSVVMLFRWWRLAKGLAAPHDSR